jgi:hypothetical protein
MRTSRAIALAAAALVVGVVAARWTGVWSPRQSSGSDADIVANMFNNPQVRTAVQDMHAEHLKDRYAGLVKQLNLSAQQADAFYSLLINHEKAQEALGYQLLSGTNNSGAGYEPGAAQKTLDDQIRSLLGESGYSQYTNYEAGMSDRNALERFRRVFADAPLSDVQQQRLLQLINAEQQAKPIPDSPDLENKTPSGNNMAAFMTLVIKRQEEINRKVLQEAGGFLSPAQIQILGSNQSNQLKWLKMTTSAAR